MHRKLYLFFIIICIFVMTVPFFGMSFWATNETTENTDMVEWPKLIKDEQINFQYLSEIGQYFENHFAFRNEMIDINSNININLFNDAPIQKVISGKEGWIFYNETLDDYQGLNLLTEREINCIINNLQLMSNYVTSKGIQFVVTVPPNKNSLYGQYMPDRYLQAESKNIDLFHSKLAQSNIQYTNLFDLFGNSDEIYYFKRDSHWTNEGALYAYNQLMDDMGIQHETYSNKSYSEVQDHEGDLDKMLYPKTHWLENNHNYDKWNKFEYLNDVKSNMDNWIETHNPSGQGKLLMYRDSFGEQILPFFANAFEFGYFSRLVPYNLVEINSLKPNCVIVERVERRLSSFAENAAIIEPQAYQQLTSEKLKTKSEINVKKDGGYYNISGTIDENHLTNDSEIFIQIIDQNSNIGVAYKSFELITNDGNGNGYQLYIPEQMIPEKCIIQIIVYNKNTTNKTVAEKILEKRE